MYAKATVNTMHGNTMQEDPVIADACAWCCALILAMSYVARVTSHGMPFCN
jgi:hypothetical protein